MLKIKPHLSTFTRITYLTGATPHDVEIGRLKSALLDRFGLATQYGHQLFLGHGTFNIMERVIHKLVNPGRMLGIGPQFNEVPSEFVAAGGKYQSVSSLQTDHLDRLHEAIDSDEFDIVYIDNPNNPTGQYLWH